MTDHRYSKKQIAAALRKLRIGKKKENMRLRRIMADLPFHKMVALQEIWEMQHREAWLNRHLNNEKRS